MAGRIGFAVLASGMAFCLTGGGMLAQGARGAAQSNQNRPEPVRLVETNTMVNPYRMLPNWPRLGNIKPGAAIGIIPDGKGGVWLQHRSDPGIVHIDTNGNVMQRFAVTFSQAHGFCRDRDGNFDDRIRWHTLDRNNSVARELRECTQMNILKFNAIAER